MSKPNWYTACIDEVVKVKPKTRFEAATALNEVLKILARNGFLDDDWWAEEKVVDEKVDKEKP